MKHTRCERFSLAFSAWLLAGTLSVSSAYGQAVAAPASPPTPAPPPPTAEVPTAGAPVPPAVDQPEPPVRAHSGGRFGGAGGFGGSDESGGGGIGGSGGAFGGYGGVVAGDLPGVNVYGGGIGGYGYGVSRTTGRRDPAPATVVAFTKADPAVLQQIQEDLTVMAHILDQAMERSLGDLAPPSRMGVPLLYTSAQGAARPIYLEGFGALFIMRVSIPLFAPPSPPHAQPEQALDSEWESARREVLGPGGSGDTLGAPMLGGETPFDPQQVEALKLTVIKALRNAANIRNLTPEEYVSVAIFGQPTAPGTVVFSSSANSNLPRPARPDAPTPPGSSRSSSAGTSAKRSFGHAGAFAMKPTPTHAGWPRETVLTFRVKGADARAFASDKISFEDFSKKVTVNQYGGGGHDERASSPPAQLF